MCTVSYLPTSDGFILTSNRDESPARVSRTVARLRVGDREVHYPKDPTAGGSWFAFAEDGAVACLLNGAYMPYDITRQFLKSRGTVMLESFAFDHADEFISSGVFEGAAPFTLVIERDGAIHEFIWDSEDIAHRTIDPRKPNFWSSVTLYPQHVREWRRDLFDQWLAGRAAFSQEEIMRFHRYGGRGDDLNDFVMNRNDIVKTLSISSVESTDAEFHFRHINLELQDQYALNIAKSKPVAPKEET